MSTPRLSMTCFYSSVTDDQIQITEDLDTEAKERGGSIGPSGSGKYKLKDATDGLTHFRVDRIECTDSERR